MIWEIKVLEKITMDKTMKTMMTAEEIKMK